MLRCIIIIAAFVLIDSNISAQQNPFNKITIGGIEYFVYPENDGPNYSGIGQYLINKLLLEQEYITLDGKWVTLYDGKPARISGSYSIKNNLLDGEYISYDTNGYVDERGFFEKGRKSGTWKYYDDCRIPYQISNFAVVKFGKGFRSFRTGECKEWYSNGNPKELCFYKVKTFKDWADDYRSGEWKTWYDNGQIKEIIYYDKYGLRDSINTLYFENGNKKTERKYHQGSLSGKSTIYYAEGNIKTIVDTGNSAIIYYRSGKKYGEGRVTDWLKTGNWIYYYENGNQKCSGEYIFRQTQRCTGGIPAQFIHSTKTGKWVYRYEDGTVMAYGEYTSVEKENGYNYISEKTGEWFYFDREGNVTDESCFNKSGISFSEEDYGFLLYGENNYYKYF